MPRWRALRTSQRNQFRIEWWHLQVHLVFCFIDHFLVFLLCGLDHVVFTIFVTLLPQLSPEWHYSLPGLNRWFDPSTLYLMHEIEWDYTAWPFLFLPNDSSDFSADGRPSAIHSRAEGQSEAVGVCKRPHDVHTTLQWIGLYWSAEKIRMFLLNLLLRVLNSRLVFSLSFSHYC